MDKLKKIATFLILLLLIFSCGKDKATEPEPETFRIIVDSQMIVNTPRLILNEVVYNPIPGLSVIGDFEEAVYSWEMYMVIDRVVGDTAILLGDGQFYLETNKYCTVTNDGVTWNY